ncbi:LysR family transcriptional regulator [Puniceibacterium sp. IMCC21224]|uniref:LysR family transcriptional regulator n=1 Tax=Puniceibacterium sp. IMCC21224 TaxID=1618204 RepID=UPI00064DFBD2|nr:LysR family transcriptional regulator [Puniceibacterium sp. IMCC21224]KMK69073.1 transcriptional regulator [Puniceibacterium sp. IMCC21224]
MFTIKQLEALCAVAAVGGFELAAGRLNVSQSTISKRIAEIESRFSEPLFDRSGRAAVLTNQGRDVLEIAQRMVHMNDELIARARHDHATPGRFAIGVTDLVALSWMPELVEIFLQQYPDTTIQPEIDLTRNLLDRLQRRELDLTICPMFLDQPEFVHFALGNVELCWLASPSIAKGRGVLELSELLDQTLLTQSKQSVLFNALRSVTSNEKLPFRRYIHCNNTAALAELAAAGLGVTLLPAAFFRRHLDSGRLVIIKSEIEMPEVEYFVSFHEFYYRDFSEKILSICQSICDFRTWQQ